MLPETVQIQTKNWLYFILFLEEKGTQYLDLELLMNFGTGSRYPVMATKY